MPDDEWAKLIQEYKYMTDTNRKAQAAAIASVMMEGLVELVKTMYKK